MMQELEGVKVYSSEDARSHWRTLLDEMITGTDAVVERHSKPIAAVIPFEDYIALIEYLEELRDAREADEGYNRWRRDPSIATPFRQARAEMVSKGLLSEHTAEPV